MMTASDLL